MASYLVTYVQAGETKTHVVLDVDSDTIARRAFMDLDWVGFSDVVVDNVEAMLEAKAYNPYRPRTLPEQRAPVPPAEPVKPVPEPAFKGGWQAQCNKLTDRIGALADEAMKLDRAGKHDRARAKRDEAKSLAEERADITRANKGK